VSLDWYPFFVVAYRRDTYHLGLAEDGAYRRLIDEYMLTRESLPSDDAALARILGISVSEWSAVAPRIRKFFRLRNGRLHHKRCEQEIRAQLLREARRSRKPKIPDTTKGKQTKGLPTSTSPPPVVLCDVSPQVSPNAQVSVEEQDAARARRGGITPAAFDLADRLMALLGWDREAPDRQGIPYVTQKWLNEGMAPDFILATVARAASGKTVNSLNFVETVLRTARADPPRHVRSDNIVNLEVPRVQTAFRHPGGAYGASKDSFRDAKAKLAASIEAYDRGGEGGEPAPGLLPAARRDES
jgi:uncharacterized protein YdaU (DUF1376 family)